MSAEGIEHSRLAEYAENRARALSAQLPYPLSGAYDSAHLLAIHALHPHMEEIWRQRAALHREFKGPVPDGARFMGLPIRAEHSATEVRLIWERPV